MKGWQRELWFDQTDGPWVMPSPNIPTLESATVFPGTVHFEGTQLSEGRGTTRPFEFIGAPSVDNPVCVLTKASGITSMDQWFAAKQPMRLGGVGAGGTASDVARAVQTALKLPVRVVEPYKGTAEIKLAAESGELDGGC